MLRTLTVSQLVDVDDRFVGVQRPALQVVAGRRAQIALEVGVERAGAGVELLALTVRVCALTTKKPAPEIAASVGEALLWIRPWFATV